MGYNNVYALDHLRDRLLIDTGPDYDGARAILSAELERPPTLVVATHAHLDHAGLGCWWQAQGVPVALGERDFGTARVGAARFSEAPEWKAFLAFVAASGAPEDVQAETVVGLERSRDRGRAQSAPGGYSPSTDGRWPTALRYESFEPARTVADEERLLGGTVTVIVSPGHTPGNLVLTVPTEGWLFSGDQLLPGITPTPAIQWEPGSAERFASLPLFFRSMQHLAAMDYTHCFPGHGEPFENVAEVIALNIAQIDQRTEKVYDVVRLGPGTLYAICEALYPRALRRRFWPIVATVQGHLDILEEDGRVLSAEGQYHVVA